MFIGNVTANAIGRNKPGLALGTAIFIAAGTAMYDALAAKTANKNLIERSSETQELAKATIQPLNSGVMIAKITGNRPMVKNDFNFLPLLIPISNKKIAKNPLKISFVNGLIPSACLAFASIPITRLPSIKRTLPLVSECLITDEK